MRKWRMPAVIQSSLCEGKYPVYFHNYFWIHAGLIKRETIDVLRLLIRVADHFVILETHFLAFQQ